MAPNTKALDRPNKEQQYFFLPYYKEVVARHPDGITSARVKELVARQILDEFDIDIADPEQSGLNPSTNRSRADQWANNLVSNRVLDDHMLVVRGGRAMLYPGADDNSRVLPQAGELLNEGQVAELNERKPIRFEARGGLTFRRSLQLAEHVRELNGRACVVGRPTCVMFDARDGRAYVEVHHVVPMAMQGHTRVNLDRSTNMVPLCPGCHACLHHGDVDSAASILAEIFNWFESVHGRSFQSANEDLSLDTTAEDLLGMYGSDAAPG
jgi:hypothetical protein